MTAPITVQPERQRRNPFADLAEQERAQRPNPFADLAADERASVELPAGVPDRSALATIRPSRAPSPLEREVAGDRPISTAEPYEAVRESAFTAADSTGRRRMLESGAPMLLESGAVVTKPERPGYFRRLADALGGFATELRERPGATLKGMAKDIVTAPIESYSRLTAPFSEEDAQRRASTPPTFYGAKVGGLPPDHGYVAPVEPRERAEAALQTLANVITLPLATARLPAQIAAGAAVGAAYSPEDPAVGATLGAGFAAAPRAVSAPFRAARRAPAVTPAASTGAREAAERMAFAQELERGAIEAGTAQPRGARLPPEPLTPEAQATSDFAARLGEAFDRKAAARTKPLEGIERPADVVERQAETAARGIRRRPKGEMPAEPAPVTPETIESSPVLSELKRILDEELGPETPHTPQPGTTERFPEGFTMGGQESRIPSAAAVGARGADAPPVFADRATAAAIEEGRPLAMRAGEATEPETIPLPENLERRVKELTDQIQQEREARNVAQRAAETDALTGVANRAALDRALPAAAADPGTRIVVFDADNFGQINKRIGQEAGDQAIKDVAAAVRQAAQEHGVGERVFRRGGDEFVVLAPESVAESVRARAEQLFGERRFGAEKNATTVSLTGTHGATFTEADAALQAAKQARKVSAARPFINWRTWGERPEVMSRIQQRTDELRAAGQLEKGSVSFLEQRKLGEQFAKELIADPLQIDREKLTNLKGYQIVALKEVVQENTAVIESAARAINSGDLSPAEIEAAMRTMGAAQKATDEALATIVRESAEAGRTLGGLRQMARQTLDPDVWLIRGKQLLGDRPMPDAVMLEIRRLAKEATLACGGA